MKVIIEQQTSNNGRTLNNKFKRMAFDKRHRQRGTYDNNKRRKSCEKTLPLANVAHRSEQSHSVIDIQLPPQSQLCNNFGLFCECMMH